MIEVLVLIIAIAVVYIGVKVEAIARMMAENQKREADARRVRGLERL